MCYNNGGSIFMEINTQYPIFRIYSSKKLIVISIVKVATRYLDRLFGKQERTYFNDIKFDYNNGFIIIPDNENIPENILNDIKLINEKKNKKDILILYRNPYERLISGIIQDFESDINHSKKNLLFDLLLDYHINLYGNKNNSEIENDVYYKYIQKSIFKNYNDINFNLVEFYKISLEKYILYNFTSNKISSRHTSNYIYLLHTIISKNILFDSNKITLIDIDKNKNILKDFLKKYDIVSKEEKLKENDSNKLPKSIVNDLISTNLKLNNLIKLYIQDEIFFYNQLKTLNQNI